MITLLTIVHVLIALVLILLVLLQNAKGADMASAFGGMGSQTAFGPRGTTTFLQKATAVLAAVFMVTSLALAILASHSHGTGGSVLSGEKSAPAAPIQQKTERIPPPASPAQQPAPTAPAAAPATPAAPQAK